MRSPRDRRALEVELKPTALDRIANTDGVMLISNAAKMLQIEVQALSRG